MATVADHYESLFGSDPRLLELRKAYAMKQGTVDTARASARAHGVHLVVRLVRGHRAPGQEHFLHQQLAARAAGGQHAAAAPADVDGVQRAVPHRRHRIAGLAPRASQGRAAARAAEDRSAGAGARDAVHEGDRQIFLAGDRAVPHADPAGRDHGALPGRRAGGLRLRALQLPAVFTEPHLAHPARGVVDRDRLARHGLVHRAGDLRA